MEIEGIEIKRLYHASFKIKKDKVIYIDPFNIDETEKADLILLTHEHFDHLSIEDILKVIDEKTIIVATNDCISKLNKFDNEIKIVNPGDSLEVINIKIEVVAAYNLNKFRAPGIPFHPKEDGKVGYIINLDEKRIYFTGDTDVTEELKNIKDIDIILIPVSGTYVMTPEEAAEAVNIIQPKVAIPCHYSDRIGSIEDANKLKELSKNTKVEII